MICNNCHEEIDDTFAFCPYCGKDLRKNIPVFTSKDRVSLSIQLQTLKMLHDMANNGQSEEIENLLTISREGFTNEYYQIEDQFIHSDSELSIDDSKYVLDILKMYRCIIYSYKQLEMNNVDVSSIDKRKLVFPGFDANDEHECKYLSYARYYLVTLDRYAEIQEMGCGDNWNSHSSLPNKYYKQMLDKLAKYKSEESINTYAMDLDHLNDLLALIPWTPMF